MNYYQQLLTVTLWEYRRFFKIKNELLGIGVMLAVFALSYYGGKFAVSRASEKSELTVTEALAPQLTDMLASGFTVTRIPQQEKEKYLQQIEASRSGMLLFQDNDGFVLHSWKKPGKLNKLQEILNAYVRLQAMEKMALSEADLSGLAAPASLEQVYLTESGSRGRKFMAVFFAGLMILAIFLSFAYQFTAITGEKQLKITEQIVSAIKPQLWMDGKILGITLTGISSMLTYSVIGILGGMLYFRFTGTTVSTILQYLHFPSIILFFIFTLMGTMLWNALMAGIASIITDPNNSGKSSLMLLPILFVVASFLVVRDPDNGVAVFLSWFPLTSATAMPMRWAVTDVAWWQMLGSFAVLLVTFYLLRKLAAKIFRVAILISGKEPSWREVVKLMTAE